MIRDPSALGGATRRQVQQVFSQWVNRARQDRDLPKDLDPIVTEMPGFNYCVYFDQKYLDTMDRNDLAMEAEGGCVCHPGRGFRGQGRTQRGISSSRGVHLVPSWPDVYRGWMPSGTVPQTLPPRPDGWLPGVREATTSLPRLEHTSAGTRVDLVLPSARFEATGQTAHRNRSRY